MAGAMQSAPASPEAARPAPAGLEASNELDEHLEALSKRELRPRVVRVQPPPGGCGAAQFAAPDLAESADGESIRPCRRRRRAGGPPRSRPWAWRRRRRWLCSTGGGWRRWRPGTLSSARPRPRRRGPPSPQIYPRLASPRCARGRAGRDGCRALPGTAGAAAREMAGKGRGGGRGRGLEQRGGRGGARRGVGVGRRGRGGRPGRCGPALGEGEARDVWVWGRAVR